jgi:hypothetical protein
MYVVMLADVVDRKDVRMVQRRSRARLLLEPLQTFGAGRKGGGQDLDRDLMSEAWIAAR